MDKLIQYTAGIMLASSLVIIQSIQPANAAGCQVLSKSTLEKKADPYSPPIRSASRKYGVHEDLVKAVITVESCFRSRARGTSGEKGLMQLMPATARRFSVRSGYNSWQNIHGGTRYLSYLLRRYSGDTRRAVAAYNAGEGNIRPGGRIYNKEYVRKVMHAYGKFAGGTYQRVYLEKEVADDGQTAASSSKRKNRIVAEKQRPARASQTVSSQTSSHERSYRRTGSRKSFRVQPGHTVYEVMRQTGVHAKEIIRINKLQAPYHLEVGQKLRLR